MHTDSYLKSTDQIDAFADRSLAAIIKAGLDSGKVNINGGIKGAAEVFVRV